MSEFLATISPLLFLVGYVWGKWSSDNFHDEVAASEAGYEKGHGEGYLTGYQDGRARTPDYRYMP